MHLARNTVLAWIPTRYITYQDIGFKMGFSDSFKQLMKKYIRSIVFTCVTTEGFLHRNGLSNYHICFSIECEHKIQRNLVNLIRIKKHYGKLMIYLFLTCQHFSSLGFFSVLFIACSRHHFSKAFSSYLGLIFKQNFHWTRQVEKQFSYSSRKSNMI